MVMRWAALALAGLLAACAAPCVPDAGDRLTLTMLRGVPIVQAHVNGTPTPMLLDTGATNTVMLPEGVERLRLPTDETRITRGRGVGGSFTTRNVLMRELRVGRRAVANLTVPVIAHALPGQPVMAGVLGADFLGISDLEVDIPARQVTLHDARSCTAGQPGWAGDYDTVPIRVLPGGWVLVRVLVDGQAVDALLDTGAALSTVRQSTALRLGMPRAVLSQPVAGQVHGAGQDRLDVRAHRFGTVQVGPDVMRGMIVGITALPEADPFDMVLGQDFMRSRRLWLSYARQRLYVQRVEAPAR
jgi:predicted aspartyl protease